MSNPIQAFPARHLVVTLLGLALAANAAAVELTDCAGIEADPVRLACYDKLAKQALPGKVTIITDAAPEAPPALPLVIEPPLPPSPVTMLSERWELDPESKAGTFQFRSHNPTFIMPLFMTSSVNSRPSSPTHAPGGNTGQRSSEVKFQLSFKTKLMENLFDGASDLWFGYTQQSHWQLYNSDSSRDFRATDYQPELILTTRTNYDLLGWRGRMLNLGVLHQSNGRDQPLSRSWNRLYAQAGFERGDWVLLARPWWRVPEKRGNDDNPDITKYMGHGDLVAMWKKSGHVVSLMGRRNFSDGGKGAMQADWAFPLSRQLKGHIQMFSGYGESLIDYNHRQTTFGIGVSLSEGL